MTTTIAPAPPRRVSAPPGAVGPRLDLHNAAVNSDAATRHLCGMQHLATGRTCTLPERHPGGCEFH